MWNFHSPLTMYLIMFQQINHVISSNKWIYEKILYKIQRQLILIRTIDTAQVIEGWGDRIVSDLNISIGSDKVFVGFISIGIRSGIRRNRMKSRRIWSDFIALRWIPMKSGPDSDLKESKKNRDGSDRFFMKDAGFRWNPTRIRSKTIGSTGRITWPGVEWNNYPGRQLRTPYTIVYGRIHAWYAPYTTVFRRITWCRITEAVYEDSKRAFFLRKSPYLSVYGHGDIRSSYFSVNDRLRQCKFDLGRFIHKKDVLLMLRLYEVELGNAIVSEIISQLFLKYKQNHVER
jgi:hypothetical protein